MKLMLLASLLIFTACNRGSGSESDDKKRDEVHCLCMPITYLTINTQDVLPQNMKIILGEQIIFDSCMEYPSVALSKKDHQIRFTFSSVVPKVANLKIVDLGEDCNNDALFFEQEDVPYQREVTSTREDQPRLEEVTFDL